MGHQPIMTADRYSLFSRRWISVEDYINLDKAQKGILMGVALGEEEHQDQMYRHYKMCNSTEEAMYARRMDYAVRGRSDDVSDMYSLDRMLMFILAGGQVKLWTKDISREIDGPELWNYRAPLQQ